MVVQSLPFTDHRTSQTDKILSFLLAGNAITPLESLERFGCFRLGARIWEIKKRGHEIETRMVSVKSGVRVAEYRIKNSLKTS